MTLRVGQIVYVWIWDNSFWWSNYEGIGDPISCSRCVVLSEPFTQRQRGVDMQFVYVGGLTPTLVDVPLNVLHDDIHPVVKDRWASMYGS